MNNAISNIFNEGNDFNEAMSQRAVDGWRELTKYVPWYYLYDPVITSG